ncbi:type II secretion system protein GspM [Paraherbaspirillum soli]|uniref:Type II secretion system protein GspM n=1 Tax=Paraherbaspirillum soli TaxID=631222 RepID=A0ABW0M5V6_9BURK
MPAFNGLLQARDKALAPLTAMWAQRNQRERTLLGAGAGFVLLALIYLLLIDPALSGRLRLQKSLPGLRQQAVELQALQAKAATLTEPQERPVPVFSKETIETALKGKGLNPKSVLLSGDIAKVELAGVAFAGLLDWLDDAQKSAHWQLVDANISAQDQAGVVNASLTLSQQKHE